MYKYYKKNEYNIMYHYFDSIIEYLNYLDNTPIANGFQNYDLSSEDTDYDWYKTNSLDEAKELIKYGYNENFDRFLELKLKLEKYIKLSVKKNKQYNYYVGYAPDVKAYLEGNPLSMLNKVMLLLSVSLLYIGNLLSNAKEFSLIRTLGSSGSIDFS